MKIAKKSLKFASLAAGARNLSVDERGRTRKRLRGRRASQNRSAGRGAGAAEAAKKEDPARRLHNLRRACWSKSAAPKWRWTLCGHLIAGMLVFFMNLGFATVESGLCRAKNTATILAKNFIVFAASSIAFLVLGWGLMFGDGNPFIGTEGLWFASGADNSPATGDAYKGVYSAINWTGVPLWTKFFFH